MPRILLSNDDGIEAPGLVAFAKALASIGEVLVSVPDTERSWMGKAMTRYDDVLVQQVERDGVVIYTCTGLPADAVQLGIYNLAPEPPDIVISGINVGYNHSAGYIESSGTAGAALEGAMARLPTVAFSAGNMVAPWPEWRAAAYSSASAPMWERLSQVAVGITRRIIGVAGPGEALNIGMPDHATDETPLRTTHVADARYQGVFAEVEPGVYQHRYGVLNLDGVDLTGTDLEAAYDGVIAVTPMRGVGDGRVSETLLQAVVG